MVAAAFFELPTGIISDLAGRKKTIIMGNVANVLSLLLYVIADSVWVLLAGAIIQGMSHAFFSGNNDAMLHDSLKEEGKEDEYANILGRTKSMFQLALCLSALVGAVIAPWSFRWAIWIAIVAQCLTLIISFFFVEPHVHSRESTNVLAHTKEAFRLFFKNAKLRMHSIGSVIWNGFGETTFYFEPAFISTLWPVWGIGIARTLDHALGWASYWYAGPAIRKSGAVMALIISLIATNVLSFLAFGLQSSLSPILLSLTAIPYGIIVVAQNSLMQKEFSDKQRATMGSLNALFGSILFGICSVLMGWIADVWNPVTAMIVVQIVITSLIPLYWLMYRKQVRLQEY